MLTNRHRLKAEKKAWQAISKPLPDVPPLQLSHDPADVPPSSDVLAQIPLPDASLLDEDEAEMLRALTDHGSGFRALRRAAQSRLAGAQGGLEFKVDHLADSVHKLDQRVATAGRQADGVLALAAERLKEREGREKKAAGTRELPVVEVLRSLGRILPQGD